MRSLKIYALALMAAGMGFLLSRVITSYTGPGLPSYITYYPFVMFAAVAGGLGPGLLTTLASSLIVDYFLLPPVGLFVFHSKIDAVGTCLFLIMGVLMSVVADLYRRRLNKQIEMYQLLAEFTHDWIYWLDNDYRFVYSSPSCKEITGYSAEEFIDDPALFSRIIHPDDLALFNEHRKALDGSPDTGEAEYRIICKNGSVRRVWHICKPIFTENGRCLGRRSSNRDITDRKMAEDSLRESEANFKRLYDANVIGVIFWDTDGNLWQANGEFCRMTGYTENEILSGKVRWKDMTPPEYAPLDVKAIEEMTKTGVATPFEKEYICKNGSRVPVLLSAAFLEGQQKLGMCFVQDLTQNKLRERAVRESEQMFRALFDDAPDGIVLSHPESKEFSMGNRAFCKMLGYDEKEIQAIGVQDIHPKESLPLVADKFQRLAKKELEVAEEVPVKRKDGSLFYADIRAAQVVLAGRPFLAGIFRDVTARREAETELKKYREHLEELVKEKTVEITESEARFKTIFEDSMDGIILADIASKKFFMCNRTICEMLGYTGEEMKRLGVNDVHPENDLPKVMEAFGKQLRGELKIAEGLPMMRKDGNVFYVDVSASLVTLSGRKYLMGSFRDITERRNAEKKVQELMDSKSAFTSMVSHELRTPLSSLKEGIALVEEGLAGPVNQKQEKLLHISKNSVDRLARLINEVLDFQTLESGKIPFKMALNNMNEVVTEVMEPIFLLAKEKGLDITLDLDKKLPKVKFDRDKISQVVSNLVNNSFKLTEKGSIAISTAKDDEGIRVSVKDTGPGIKEEDLPRLFKQYEQLERKVGGTGLGLAICMDIIKAHSGKIWAESKPGFGTTFQFVLPIEEGKRN